MRIFNIDSCNIDYVYSLDHIVKPGETQTTKTLLSSLRDGGAGYCGIMCNFHPELYVWLCENYNKHPKEAEESQSLIGTVGFTENGLPYPLAAKYHMYLEGFETENIARVRNSSELTGYVKDCVKQMKLLCDNSKKFLGTEKI